MTDPSGTATGKNSPIPEEAAKLFEAAQDWARRMFGEGEHARIATGAPECQWCPVCQLISYLRGEHPEVNDKIVEVGEALVGAIRNLIEGGGSNGAHAAGAHSYSQQTPNVQKIDLNNKH